MQVPENQAVKAVLSESEQLELLRQKLSGNHSFAACRGRLGLVSMRYQIERMIEQNPSPTAVLAAWDALVSQPRIMVNLLAQLKRDGNTYAFDQLFKALSEPDHLLPGETVPIEKTEPLTILMLDPKRTILFLRWLVERGGHWMDLDSWLDVKDGRKTPESNQRRKLGNMLFKAFPTLEKHTRERRRYRQYEGWDLVAAYHDAITMKFPKVLVEALRKGSTSITWGQWNNHIEDMQDIPFLYVIRGEQSDVLKLFNRKDQRRIATWQINAPIGKIRYMDIGLYPETFEDEYVKAKPHLQSLGASHGYKMILSDIDNEDKWVGRLGCNHGEKGKYGILFDIPEQIYESKDLVNSGEPTR